MKTHIQNIGIENFKVFKDKTDFGFAPITILTGTNSSGKSSLVRAFYLMSHCFKSGDIEDILDIEDVMNILGDFSKLPNKLNLRIGKKDISFFIPIVLRGIVDTNTLKISYRLIDNSLQQGKLAGISILSKKEGLKEIFSVEMKESIAFVIKLDVAYFLNEYKRESNQIIAYHDAEENFEDSDLSKIHPEYYYFKKNKNNPRCNQYKPFFDKLSGFFKEDENLNFLGNFYKYANKEAVYYEAEKKIIKVVKDKKILDDDILKTINQIENKILTNIEVTASIIMAKRGGNPAEDYPINQIMKSFDYFLSVGLNGFFRGYSYSGYNLRVELNIENLGLDNDLLSSFYLTRLNLENQFDELKIERDDFFFECFIDDNIRYSISEALEQFDQCYFLGNYRNQIQRVYNGKDGSDFQSLIKRIVLATEDEKKDLIIKKYFKKYLTRFGIGHGIEIVNSGEGQGYFLYILVKGEKILLADLGYGISQVLPLIFKIISVALEDGGNKKLFIEEPESNLHPALQSKLAELFADAAENFGIQFVIETHSEYFIRKLQMLTANTYAKNRDNRLPALKTKDTQLYYFYPQDDVPEGEKQVYKINIEEDGALTKNFGKGFFDESSNLNIALYNFTSANKN